MTLAKHRNSPNLYVIKCFFRFLCSFPCSRVPLCSLFRVSVHNDNLQHRGNMQKTSPTGADLGGEVEGAGGAHPPPPPTPEMTCGFLIQLVFCKKTMWFIGVEVEQETSAPPPKKNPGSAPAPILFISRITQK